MPTEKAVGLLGLADVRPYQEKSDERVYERCSDESLQTDSKSMA